MEKWNIIVDVANCTNCRNCAMAVMDEYVGNTFPGYSLPHPSHGHHWVNIERRERGSGSLMDVSYLNTMCNQCDNAPCIKAAKDGAVYKRKDGIVMIDPDKSKGQKHLVKSCPYGNIWWNEEFQVPQKYSFDAHLLDIGWTEPRITQVCASGCLSAAKLDDAAMQRRAEAEGLETLEAGRGTHGHVWYRNLALFTKEHIAGSVATVIDGLEECCAEADVTVMKAQKSLQHLKTDFFGDFKFDALDANSGDYTIRVMWNGLSKEVHVKLTESVNIGVVMLGRQEPSSSTAEK